MEWEWYNDSNTFRLFIHLLLKANHKAGRWQGIEIQPGQVIIGRKKLAVELKLTERQIRTSLTKLKMTNEIATKTTNKFTIVTICKWAQYQTSEEAKRPTERPATKPTGDQQTTTNNNENNEKNIKKVKKFIPPTLDMVQKYFSENGYSKELAERVFNGYAVAEWHDSKGNKIKNWRQKCQHVWFKSEYKNSQINGNYVKQLKAI